jgi:putative nucleotidyltransferase with HDIG domain
MSPIVQAMLAQVDSIGTVPTSSAQLFSLIGNDKAGPEDFERVVRPDLGLTANLLKCANSVLYRGSREITSAREAINRMGLRRVFEVAASASFAQTIPERLTGYQMGAKEYWAHAVAVAVLADRIGRAAGFTYPDLAFTAGLLHDLGKVVVATALGEQPDAPAFASVDQEREALGTDHAELGEQLALRWHLPKEICGAARWHHEPDSAPTATLRSVATVVQLADGAAHVAGYGEGQTCVEALDPGALERLNLEPQRVHALIGAASTEIENMLQTLTGAAPRKAA